MQLEEMGKNLRRKGQKPENQDKIVTGGRISLSLVSHLENGPDGHSENPLAWGDLGILKGTSVLQTSLLPAASPPLAT